MLINITINGDTTPAQVRAIARAILQLDTELPEPSINVTSTGDARQPLKIETNLGGTDVALSTEAPPADYAAAKAIITDITQLDEPQSAIPLPPTAASAPSTADASASPTAQEASEVFSPSTPIDASPPAPTNPVPAAVAAGLVTDAKGLPWDARIHAGSKTKNADGSWRQRRNLNDSAMVTRVEAELRGALAAGPSTGESQPSASSVATAAPSVPQPPSEANAQTSFAGFMKWYVPLVSSGAIKAEDGDAVIKEMGLQSITQLAIRPDMIGQVKAAVSKLLPEIN